LFLFTMADEMRHGERVVEALRTIAQRTTRTNPAPPLPLPATPPQTLSPRPVFFHPAKRRLALYDSIGAISAETIACYPPGSALIVAGEEITLEVIEFLAEVRRRGGTLKGASDANFKTIQVIE
jgi:ornithine decarboxylase